MSSDRTPNASGKHVSLLKHCALFRSSGAKNVDIKDPTYMAVMNLLKNWASCCCCSGN